MLTAIYNADFNEEKFESLAHRRNWRNIFWRQEISKNDGWKF